METIMDLTRTNAWTSKETKTGNTINATTGAVTKTLPLVVCIGSSCHLKGSRQVVEQLQALVARYNLRDRIELSGTFCMGNCQNGVCVTFDGKPFSLSPDTVDSFFTTEVLPRFH